MPALFMAVIAGIALGILVNYLADTLPRFRVQDDESEEVLDTPGEALEAEPVVAETAPLAWSPARLLSPRALAVIAVLIVASVGLEQRGDTLVQTAFLYVYIALFTLIAVIDIEHKLVLTVVMIPAFIIAFIELLVTRRLTFASALAGYAFGQIVVMAIYLAGALYIWLINARRTEPIRDVAFGFGDVTLATFCGLVLGLPWALPMILLMVLIGGAMALVFLVVRLLIVRKYQAHMAIPYGPAIVIAAAAILLWGEQLAPYLLPAR